VQYRKVATGPLFAGLRVIDSGLDANDVIIVNGLQHVRPGAQVNPQKVAMQYRLTDSDKALVDANPAAPTLNKDGTNTALAAAAAANKNKRSQD